MVALGEWDYWQPGPTPDCGLQHPTSRIGYLLRWTVWKRLLGGYPHQRGLCSRTAYWLYLHHLGWGMGLLWYHNCNPTLCYTLPKNMVSGWKPEMQILSYLRILCSSYLFHSLLYQYQYGHRNHAYHRDSPTLFQLWRFWTVGIYHVTIYLPKAEYE